MKSQSDAAPRMAAEVVTQLPVPSRLGMLRFERLNEASWALLYLDPGCERHFGLPAAELCALVGSPYASLMEPKARYRLHDAIELQLRASPHYIVHYTLHTAHGALNLMEVGEPYKQHNRHLLRGYLLVLEGPVSSTPLAPVTELETQNSRLHNALELNQRAQQEQLQHLERVRAQQLNRLKAELNNPNAIAGRLMAPMLYGTDHPYGIPPSGLGDAKSVTAVTRDQLAAFHATWIRPDNARVFVVGDTTLAEVKKQLDATLGAWKAPKTAKPVKNFDIAIPAPKPRILLFDRPKSPQSVILAGKVLDAKGGDQLEVLRSANDIFGGNFLSRFNTNLRETKGWSYGVRSRISGETDRLSWVAVAPVQADRTGDSIKELQKDLKGFLADKGVTKEELERTINGSVRELPGSFETSADVLAGLRNIVKFSRPDNYYETLPATYEAMTTAEIDAAARKALSTDDLV